MKWNAEPALALTLLLAAGGSISEARAGQSTQAPNQSAQDAPQVETWRAADGTIRSRTRPSRQPVQPTLAREPVPEYAAPAPSRAPEAPEAPGASYAPPGTDHSPPPPRTMAPSRLEPEQDPAYQDPTSGLSGPRGSSQPAAGEQRYDEIGFAGVRSVVGGPDAEGAVVASHRTLPVDSYVEVTALDSGRTILVLVTGSMPGADHPVDLSPGAARQLGATGDERIPVRIRRVNAPAGDVMLLRAGRPATDRPDAPPVLLSALRKRLPGAAIAVSQPVPAAARPATPRPAPARATRAPSGRGFYVQVAALSNARNAQALAQSMNGFVKQGGGLHRVQLGPFATRREADAARAGAARAGYGDARVIAVN